MSRVYRGEIRYGELENLAAHKPIVDEPLWRSAQRAFVSRGRRPEAEQLLNRLGILVCGSCGAPMGLSRAVRGGRPYPGYRCGADAGDCRRRAYIAAATADRETLAELSRVIPASLRGEASVETDVEEARLEAAAARAKLEQVGRAYAASGIAEEDFAVEELSGLRREWDDREDEHRRLLSAARRRRTFSIADLDSATLLEQRALVADVFARIRVLPGRGPGRLRFDLLAQ
jgi:hypothetical protein